MNNPTKYLITALISITSLVMAQQPLTLEVAFTGQSVGDQSKPNIEVTLSNISGRSFKILQPKAGSLMQNIRLVIVPEGQDSIFMDLDDALFEDRRAGKSFQIKPLPANGTLTTEFDLFSGAYTELAGINTFTAYTVYQSVYRSGDPEVEPRANLWPRDIKSNVLAYP